MHLWTHHREIEPVTPTPSPEPDRPRLILASASPRRVELLKRLGIEFSVAPSAAEELHDEQIGPVRLCALIAERKAAEVAGANPEAVVIGADTLVALRGRIFGKPADLDEARRTLAELSGETHQVVTGVCLLHFKSGRCEVFSVRTDVTFARFGREVIESYIGKARVLDKAGAYGIQEHGEMLVASISGS